MIDEQTRKRLEAMKSLIEAKRSDLETIIKLLQELFPAEYRVSLILREETLHPEALAFTYVGNDNPAMVAYTLASWLNAMTAAKAPAEEQKGFAA